MEKTEDIQRVRALDNWGPAGSSKKIRSPSNGQQVQQRQRKTKPERAPQYEAPSYQTKEGVLDALGSTVHTCHSPSKRLREGANAVLKATGEAELCSRIQPVVPKGVLSPTVKAVSGPERKTLRTQKKVLASLNRGMDARRAEPNLLKLFREIGPDEFGLVQRSSFNKTIQKKFELDPADAERLFDIGDPEQRNELNFIQFRTAFRQLDQANPLQPSPYRRVRARTEDTLVPKDSLGCTSESRKSNRGDFSAMSNAERAEYRFRNRIQYLMEHKKGDLRKVFHMASEDADAINIRTKLSCAEASSSLKKLGVEVSEEELQRHFGKGGAQGLTYSQLCRQTADYFTRLQGDDESGSKDRKKNLKGRFLGCRKLGTGPAGKIHISDGNFLAHDEGPYTELPPSRTIAHDFWDADVSGDTKPVIPPVEPLVAEGGAHLWKSHWSTKTLSPEQTKNHRNTRKTTVNSGVFQRGAGDIITWGSPSAKEQQVASTPPPRRAPVPFAIDF